MGRRWGYRFDRLDSPEAFMSAQPVPRPSQCRRKGFSPFPNEFLLDWPRLVSGDAQVYTLMLIVSETLGAIPEAGRKPEWSRSIPTEEFAEFSRVGVRAVQVAIDDLITRKVLLARGPKGARRYRIPFETWPELPDRPKKVVTLEAAEDAEEESEDEAKAHTRGEVIPVYEKPVRLKSGARPRPKELPKIASKLRVQSNHELEYSAVLCDGLLDIHLNVVLTNELAKQGRKQANKTALPSASDSGNLKIPHVSFEKFEDMALKCQLPASKSDLVKARKIWAGVLPPDGWESPMAAEDRADAFKGLEDRFISGEYPAKPEYRKLLVNYLKDRVWERKPRVTRKTALVARAPRPAEYDCPLCFDSGLIVPNTGNQAKDLENATPCKCKAGRKRA
jgi:hypothetical protein